MSQSQSQTQSPSRSASSWSDPAGAEPDHLSGLEALAERHGVGVEAVRHLAQALERGGGGMAQFDHPDLGGLGQWSAGGMLMVGRMFDDALKARVGALCAELAAALPAGGFAGPGRSAGERGGGQWWPADLGTPASVGGQDGGRYAYFPQARRLAVDTGGEVVLYDTGTHAISGFGQADGRLNLTGPGGPLDLDRLRRIQAERAPPRRPDPDAAPARHAGPQAALQAGPHVERSGERGAPAGDVIATIERLAGLHARGILTEREFADKKTELLARL